MQPGLVHQAEQAERPQGDRLATGVRPGHHERGVALAQPDVDGNDAAGQPGMPGGQQDDVEPIGGLGPDRPHLARQVGLGRPEVEPRQRVERLPQVAGVGGHERGQLVEDPGNLLGLGDLGLAPGVAELDHDERLDEQGLAAARRVVDDALDPRPGLGLDRHHVAAVAERDDRLLEGIPKLRPDQCVQASTQPIVGDADRGPEAPESRRGGVEQLADRIEGAGQRRAQGRQGVQVLAERPEERAPLVGQARREPHGRIERGGDLEELGRLQPAAPRGSLVRRADVVGAADPDPGALLEQRSRLVGLVEAARHDHRVARRLERLGQPPRRREGGGGRQPLPDDRELEQRERPLVHRRQRCRAGPDTDGWPARLSRHGRLAHGSAA